MTPTLQHASHTAARVFAFVATCGCPSCPSMQRRVTVTCNVTHLFQQVDELISGQSLEQGEVRELRGISPGTVSHDGPRQGQDDGRSSTAPTQ